MRIVVTGGAGFIGSNLCESLVDEHEVVVYDNFSLGNMNNLKNIKDKVKVVNGDITDKKIMSLKCDLIVHLAGASSAPMFLPDPSDGVMVNVKGFLNIMECAKKNNLKVIYASTSSIYGNNPTPLTEDQKVMPPNFYSMSKLAMENLAHIYKQDFGIDSVGLRFMSVYGPHEKAKGKFANLVSQFIWWMLEGEQPVLYGDGTQTRDFIYVKDIVQAIKLCMDVKGAEIYNVGTGKAHSLKQLVDLLNEVMGTSIEPKYVDNPIKNYIMAQLADITKISKLGYKPNYTFKRGIEECYKFYR
jgi:UDP-glucose 4-epimerase